MTVNSMIFGDLKQLQYSIATSSSLVGRVRIVSIIISVVVSACVVVISRCRRE